MGIFIKITVFFYAGLGSVTSAKGGSVSLAFIYTRGGYFG